MPKHDEFLTIGQAATKARMSRSAIYDACKRRLLAHYRISGSGRRGKLLIRPEDLDRFIENQRVEAAGKQRPAPPAPKPPPLKNLALS